MQWICLCLAGVLEVTWAVGLKYSEGMSRPGIAVCTVIAALLSFFFLSLSMKSLPLGTAYALWTGIGTLGAAVMGILLFGESVSPVRLFAIGLIVAGGILLKMASTS